MLTDVTSRARVRRREPPYVGRPPTRTVGGHTSGAPARLPRPRRPAASSPGTGEGDHRADHIPTTIGNDGPPTTRWHGRGARDAGPPATRGRVAGHGSGSTRGRDDGAPTIRWHGRGARDGGPSATRRQAPGNRSGPGCRGVGPAATKKQAAPAASGSEVDRGGPPLKNHRPGVPPGSGGNRSRLRRGGETDSRHPGTGGARGSRHVGRLAIMQPEVAPRNRTGDGSCLTRNGGSWRFPLRVSSGTGVGLGCRGRLVDGRLMIMEV